MPKREPILDDPETLKMVKDEFEEKYPFAGRGFDIPTHANHEFAAILWEGFRAGFEAGYWADEIPLHSG